MPYSLFAPSRRDGEVDRVSDHGEALGALGADVADRDVSRGDAHAHVHVRQVPAEAEDVGKVGTQALHACFCSSAAGQASAACSDSPVNGGPQ